MTRGAHQLVISSSASKNACRSCANRAVYITADILVSLDDKFLYFSNWCVIPLSCISATSAWQPHCSARMRAAPRRRIDVWSGSSEAQEPLYRRIRGDINQYDISDLLNPKHVGRVFTGGSIRRDSGVTVTGAGRLLKVAAATFAACVSACHFYSA